MIWMVREEDPTRVHMVPAMLMTSRTVCGEYQVEQDDLKEVAESPTCISCTIIRIGEVKNTWLARQELDAEGYEFRFWFRTLLMDTDVNIKEQWRPEVDGPLTPGILTSLQEAQVLLELLEEDEGIGREEFTRLCLLYSICPLHRIDYKLCFDTDDVTCYEVRLIHPVHET